MVMMPFDLIHHAPTAFILDSLKLGIVLSCRVIGMYSFIYSVVILNLNQVQLPSSAARFTSPATPALSGIDLQGGMLTSEGASGAVHCFFPLCSLSSAHSGRA